MSGLWWMDGRGAGGGGRVFGEKLPIGKTVFKLSDLRVNRKPEKLSFSTSKSNNDIIMLSQRSRESRAMTSNPPAAAAPLHKPTPEELQEAVTKVISEVGPMPM